MLCRTITKGNCTKYYPHDQIIQSKYVSTVINEKTMGAAVLKPEETIWIVKLQVAVEIFAVVILAKPPKLQASKS